MEERILLVSQLWMGTVLDVWHGIVFCPDRSVELRIAFGPSMTALVYHLSRSFRLLDIKCNLFFWVSDKAQQ